jgi:hypothetical protein
MESRKLGRDEICFNAEATTRWEDTLGSEKANQTV